MTLNTSMLSAYFCQQKQLGAPDYVLSRDLIDTLELKKSRGANDEGRGGEDRSKDISSRLHGNDLTHHSVLQQKTVPSVSNSARLSTLRPIETLISARQTIQGEMRVENLPSAGSDRPKREALKQLYALGCNNCHLGAGRTKWVFGAGNAEAQVMVIGEAPGAEEDAQGLPFVGAAGQILTKMLAAINLDRSKDLFITNVLKCRPPGNRNPESTEIQLCFPLLSRQIDIIQPRAILLLGKIAANAVLDSGESIAKMRSRVHDYRGIPVMVIYHPAALLRNAEYKRPAWEDLQKFQALLENLGVYGPQRQP